MAATQSRNILIVEDDADFRHTLAEQLRLHEEFEVEEAGTGEAAIADAEKTNFNAILLDVGLPDMDGRDVCRVLRRKGIHAPVIMLTALDGDADTVLGLDSGANDYVTKPYAVSELMARVRAQLRRTRPSTVGETLSFDDIVLDAETHRVHRAGRPLKLGPTEFRLLATFMEKPGRVWSRDQLLDRVWGRDVYVDTRTVDVHIARLRKALTSHGGDDPIRTVRGAGYALG